MTNSACVIIFLQMLSQNLQEYFTPYSVLSVLKLCYNNYIITSIGNYQLAYRCYKSILKSFPNNIDCLKFLVRLSTDQGLNDESAHYNELLRRAEKSLEAKRQVMNHLHL